MVPVGPIAEAILVARNTHSGAPPNAAGLVLINPALREYAQRITSLRVEFDRRTLDQDLTRGMIRRYTDHAVVTFSPDLNTCWKRFVVCKELMHLLVDTSPACYTTDPIALLEGIFLGSTVLPGTPVSSEQYAFVAALEYMLPHTHRPVSLDNADNTAMKVAHRFKVPQACVEFFYGTRWKENRELVIPTPAPVPPQP